jgi:hypothetical protein
MLDARAGLDDKRSQVDVSGSSPVRHRQWTPALLPGGRPARRAGDRAAARVSRQLVHVPRPDSAAGRRLSGDSPPTISGFGLSDAPPVEEFDYTFDALADLTAGLLGQLDLGRYAIYVQDYGAPIGWRLALRVPGTITAIVTQNGNGYDAGFVDSFWRPVRDYQREQTPETEAAVRPAFTLEAIRWQYLTGGPDETLVSPDTWQHDHALLSRAGNDRIQLALFRDYATNPPLYPRLHGYLRSSRVPVLAVWAAVTRSSARPERRRSPRTPTAPRSTCSRAGTSCWRAPVRRSPP